MKFFVFEPNFVEPANWRTELKFMLRPSLTSYLVAAGDCCFGGRKRSVDFGNELFVALFIVDVLRPDPTRSSAL